MSPVRPAPATPNREPMIATPATEPRAAPPAVPIIAPTPVAMRGAANPPVNPVISSQHGQSAKKIHHNNMSYQYAECLN